MNICKKKSEIKNVKFGTSVTIIEPVNIYGCEIKSHVFVGPFVEIQQGVVIGEKTKIQSHTFICELVTIGNECFIGHGVVFINDAFQKFGPAMGDKNFWQRTIIGNNVSIGSNSTILPIQICDNTIIGAGSVVTKNITKPGVYAGNPAKLLRDISLD